METPPGCFPRTQEKLDLRCWPPVLQTPLTKSRHFLLIGRPGAASNPRKMFVYGTRSAPSSLARKADTTQDNPHSHAESVWRDKPDYRARLASDIWNRSLTASLNFC